MTQISRRTLIGAFIAAALLLAGCSPPDKKLCTDYRYMAFAEQRVTGWSDLYSTTVCVVSEKEAGRTSMIDLETIEAFPPSREYEIAPGTITQFWLLLSEKGWRVIESQAGSRALWAPENIIPWLMLEEYIEMRLHYWRARELEYRLAKARLARPLVSVHV